MFFFPEITWYFTFKTHTHPHTNDAKLLNFKKVLLLFLIVTRNISLVVILGAIEGLVSFMISIKLWKVQICTKNICLGEEESMYFSSISVVYKPSYIFLLFYFAFTILLSYEKAV